MSAGWLKPDPLSMEAMKESFAKMLTPLMKQLEHRIRKEGIDEVMKSDALLRELNEVESKADPATARVGDDDLKSGHGNADANREFKDLKKELQQDPEKTVEKNFEEFNRKFEKQKRDIIDAVKNIVTHESDRVIDAVLAGPHEKIKDKVHCP